MEKFYVTALRCPLAAMLLGSMSAHARDIVIPTTKTEYVLGGVRYHFELTSRGISNASPLHVERS